MTSGQTPTNPIVFFGTEDFSLYSLRALVSRGYHVAAVVTKPDTKRGRGHKLTEPAVKLFAREQDIPVWQPTRLRDIAEDIRKLQPAGVLVSYGKIIPQAIIDLFEPGIINVHPSLLPLYRGPSPIEAAILTRDDDTGVSIMQLTREMDAGPVYAQQKYSLDGTETQSSLYEALGNRGADMLVETLPAILSGGLTPTPQDDSAATYCQLLSKETSWLDTKTMTAAEAEAQIRAYEIFPRTRYDLDGQTIIITRAHVTDSPSHALTLAFHDGSILEIDELIAPSGKKISAQDFLRGYRVH